MDVDMYTTSPLSVGAVGATRWGINIRAASRLSFTLIDLNGEGGRRNGMASLSLADPYFEATVFPSDENVIEVDTASEKHVDDIRLFIERIQAEWGWPKLMVKVNNGLPAHTGFGSKTTTLLSIGKAYAQLFNFTVETKQLAKLCGRAGTSGASVNLIDRGGYLVDGGHANPADFNEDPQKYLLPSRFAHAATPPPVLINFQFPNWPILLMVTNGVELYGKPELSWFRKTLPIPLTEAQRTAHHVLMLLSTSVAEKDYFAFCKALNTLTYEHHYKQEQIAIQPQPVKDMFTEARTREEIDAIGISVTGPMCFAFTRNPSKAFQWCEALKAKGTLKSYWFSNAQNHPAVLKGVVK